MSLLEVSSAAKGCRAMSAAATNALVSFIQLAVKRAARAPKAQPRALTRAGAKLQQSLLQILSKELRPKAKQPKQPKQRKGRKIGKTKTTLNQFQIRVKHATEPSAKKELPPAAVNRLIRVTLGKEGELMSRDRRLAAMPKAMPKPQPGELPLDRTLENRFVSAAAITTTTMQTRDGVERNVPVQESQDDGSVCARNGAPYPVRASRPRVGVGAAEVAAHQDRLRGAAEGGQAAGAQTARACRGRATALTRPPAQNEKYRLPQDVWPLAVPVRRVAGKDEWVQPLEPSGGLLHGRGHGARR